MSSLLTKVQKKMTLYSHQKVRNVLEGEYGSVFKGRSMDFDDLRLYVAGDDVKDIDWKATARSGGQVLVKRYIAIRKHNILLLVNTGRSMAASSPDGGSKRDISVLVSGIIGSIASKHGDLVALVSGDSASVQYLPLKGNVTHIERILQRIDRSTVTESPRADLDALLDYTARTIRRRMMILVVSDEVELTPTQVSLIRRLRAQHEVMFVGIDDASPCDPRWVDESVYDTDVLNFLPEYVREQPMLETAVTNDTSTRWRQSAAELDRLAVTHVRIGSEQETMTRMIELLERQKHVRR